MAMVTGQQQQQQPQQTYKHFCRICKKGFGCGRALGGHMRAHGINDDPISVGGGHAELDDDPSACGEWGDNKLNPPPNNKRMYALRTNPNRLKSCRVCENCGKEFVSWKSFLEHGKCSSDEESDNSLVSSPRSDADDDGPLGNRSCAGWSKRKRSRRAKSAVAAPVSVCPLSEEEDLANCLVMLSAARVDPMVVVETEESCASASKEEDRQHYPIAAAEKSKEPATASAVPKGMFECKACKKVFSSHQALGGHRASHKKVKGCFAAKLNDLDEAPPEDEVITHGNVNHEAAAAATAMAMAIVPFDNPPLSIVPLKKKSKVHECSICHRQFTSGQALGGHKRCHWITSSSPDPTSNAKLQQMQDHTNHHHHGHQHHELTLRPMFNSSEPLDLNLPAPVDELSGIRQDTGSQLRLDVPAAIYLQPWVDHNHGTNNRNKATTSSNNDNMNNNNEGGCSVNVDDEVDSKIKLAKLSELKDMNVAGEASSWLQVGIGSSANEGSET